MTSVVVVCVPFRLIDEELSVWLDSDPARLPSASLGERESEATAREALLARLPFARELDRCESCGAHTDPDRAAGRREVALVSWCVVRARRSGEAAPGAAVGGWHRLGDALAMGDLVDDHARVLRTALSALRREVLADAVTRRILPRHLLRAAADGFGPDFDPAHRQPALFGLLPDPFPLSAIRRFYERLLGRPIDRGNFRRKLAELRPTGVLKELPIYQRGVRHRAAQLFTFDPHAWERWTAGVGGASGADAQQRATSSASTP